MRALLLAAALTSAPAPDAASNRVEALAGAPAASTGSVVLPAMFLLALAAAAFVLARRKRATSGRRVIEVVESASLGPRRSLVVARVGEEVLVLGVSEAGIALLGSRAAAGAVVARDAAEAVGAGDAAEALGARREETVPGGSPAWRAHELELRRKLEQGRAGSGR